jgi:hypothetical protein
MRRTRKTTLFTAILATLAVVLVGMPANAAVTGGGTVVGTVKIGGSGIPTATQPPAPTTYTFGAVNITGVFRSGNGGTFIGTIKVTGVKGGSPKENTLSGKGTVDPFAVSGTGIGTGKITGSCSGKFTRNLSIVVVNLKCSLSVSGKPAQTAKVTVYANFTPTSGNGVTTRVKAANFAGVYVST